MYLERGGVLSYVKQISVGFERKLKREGKTERQKQTERKRENERLDGWKAKG